MIDIEFRATSEADTDALGLAIAACLVPSVTIGLTGTLGAGKTRLVKAIARGLGVDAKTVVSPTFALIQNYVARLDLVHMDAYRVGDEDEFRELGMEEYFESESVVLVEWADRFRLEMPPHTVWIDIDLCDDERLFRIQFSPVGASSGRRCRAGARGSCPVKDWPAWCLVGRLLESSGENEMFARF